MILMQKCNLVVTFLIFINNVLSVSCANNYFNRLKHTNASSDGCTTFAYKPPKISYHQKIAQFSAKHPLKSNLSETTKEKDPMEGFGATLNKILFGTDEGTENIIDSEELNVTLIPKDKLAHYTSGQVLRAELFGNKTGVHLPLAHFMQNGHCYLQITEDHMQTAVNAFSIFQEGTIDDVLRLPPLYVLRSARTISMMKIAREKLVATWEVVKRGLQTVQITHKTLEMYRPLFKYINGREIAKLNLSDERILSYIGTHADLDRHQVGVVASKYIKLNEHWKDVKYLNLMNNLICGVPFLYMRTLSENTYLQLSHQLFYHIRSCDPLQRRFYLHLMTKTQVLGKSNSWCASDVARLGLLLTEVDVSELSAINPPAMIGVTAQVMLEMAPQKLMYLTETQVKYMSQKTMNILAKKLQRYQDEMEVQNSGTRFAFWIHLALALQLSCSVLPNSF